MITFSDIQKIPLIDTHVHRFHYGRPIDFGQLGGGYIPGPGQQEFSRNTFLFAMIMEHLRELFGMPSSASWAEIEAERNRQYQEDPRAYLARTVSGKNVAMYCLEIGSPLGAPLYSPEEIAYFDSVFPAEKQSYIVRIERIMDDMLPQKLPFTSFMQQYDYELSDQIVSKNAIGIKSCAAYYGGLDINNRVSFAEAEAAYERIRADKDTPQDTKCLDNYLILHSIDAAVEYDIPIQFHTGAGSGTYADFLTQNPMHMVNFLKDSRVMNRVKVVLLHGGHPHEADTSYLVAQFSNVYTDFSGALWFTSINAANCLRTLMERAPITKIMYGSDGYMSPELYGFAPDFYRRTIVTLLNQIVADGFATQAQAIQIAKNMMNENALGCYTKLAGRVKL